MYKFIFGLWIVLCGCSCQNSLPNRTAGVDGLFDVTVALVDVDRRAFCAGVVVTDGILTANHCVDDTDVVNIAFEGDVETNSLYFRRTTSVRVLRRDPISDLALLQNPIAAPVAQLGVMDFRPGDAITMLGHPAGSVFVIHFGQVSSRHQRQGLFLIRIGLVPGFSGGPIFDKYGLLIGIAVGRLAVPGNILPIPEAEADMGLMIPIDTVRLFLENRP